MGVLIFFKKIMLLQRDIQCNNHVSAWKLAQWGNNYPNITQAVSSHSDPHPNILYIAIPRLWGFWYFFFFKKFMLLPRDIQWNNHVSAWKLVQWGNYYPQITQAVSSHSDPRPNVLYTAITRLWVFFIFFQKNRVASTWHTRQLLT